MERHPSTLRVHLAPQNHMNTISLQAARRSVALASVRQELVLQPTRRYRSIVIQDGKRFRMAVLGSGPAGFYTAYKLMSNIKDAVVDMYERLPVPYGLVRYGVAPDHPEVKVSRWCVDARPATYINTDAALT
jgi:hypothetical protein